MGGDEARITVLEGGGGLLAYHTEYPDEGSQFLGDNEIPQKMES